MEAAGTGGSGGLCTGLGRGLLIRDTASCGNRLARTSVADFDTSRVLLLVVGHVAGAEGVDDGLIVDAETRGVAWSRGLKTSLKVTGFDAHFAALGQEGTVVDGGGHSMETGEFIRVSVAAAQLVSRLHR